MENPEGQKDTEAHMVAYVVSLKAAWHFQDSAITKRGFLKYASLHKVHSSKANHAHASSTCETDL